MVKRTRKTRRTRRKQRKNTASKKMDITVGILSWKAPKTIENTLESYKKNHLFDIVHPIIYFQERNAETDALAAKYGIKEVMGDSNNTGIARGLIDLIKRANTKYFIFAESDFELVNDKATTEKILKEAIRLMEEKDVQVVRLRDKKQPGVPHGARDFAPVSDEELPNYKFDSGFPYKIEVGLFPGDIKLDKAFPGLFEEIKLETTWYKTSSHHAPWSNQAFIASTKFLKERLLPVLEPEANIDIKKMEGFLIANFNGFNVAAGHGLFKHNRLDR